MGLLFFRISWQSHWNTWTRCILLAIMVEHIYLWHPHNRQEVAVEWTQSPRIWVTWRSEAGWGGAPWFLLTPTTLTPSQHNLLPPHCATPGPTTKLGSECWWNSMWEDFVIAFGIKLEKNFLFCAISSPMKNGTSTANVN